MGKRKKKRKKCGKPKVAARPASGGFPIRMTIPGDARVVGDFKPYQERFTD